MSVSIISTIKYQRGKREFINTLIETQLRGGVKAFRFNAHWIKSSEDAIEFKKDIEYWRGKNEGFIYLLDISLYKSKPRIHHTQLQNSNCFRGDELVIGSIDTFESVTIDIERIGLLVEKGQILMIADGQGAMQVVDIISEDKIKVQIINDFVLGQDRGIHGLGLRKSDRLNENWEYIIRNAFPDKVIVSFVESFDDAVALQDIYPIKNIVSKIETIKGIENIDEILKAETEVMIGRGDLGLSAGVESFYSVQNKLLLKLAQNGRKYSVATDLFPSLNKRFYPSRADIVDVSNILQYKPSSLVITYDLTSNNKVLEVIRVVNEMIDNN